MGGEGLRWMRESFCFVVSFVSKILYEVLT
jgi:hypothetical protein